MNDDLRELTKYMYDLRQETYYFCQADSSWTWDLKMEIMMPTFINLVRIIFPICVYIKFIYMPCI